MNATLRPYGEVLDEMDHQAKYQSATDRPQLVARIKRSSKYYGQTERGEWFDVRVVGDRSYPLRGNNNNYRISDVNFGVRLDDGTIVELK
jgi:hypothetical protein